MRGKKFISSTTDMMVGQLQEIAAVDEPKMHLWETGIMRITRHPQVRNLLENEHSVFFFTGVSLPLAVSPAVYFINQRYDGGATSGCSCATWNLFGLLTSFPSFSFIRRPSTYQRLRLLTSPRCISGKLE
ncbi:15-cis-zeta-carotene isomerase [Perilla frutescens var. frutescens]|nr:15-cis-zeta-carotene isomerase [Perilla frutescens var. frutescens]